MRPNAVNLQMLMSVPLLQTRADMHARMLLEPSSVYVQRDSGKLEETSVQVS